MTDRIDASGHNWDLTWTVENRLATATNTTTGTTIAFVYDGDGQMVQRTVGGSVTHYLGKRYHQTPSSGPSVKHYAFNGQLVVRLWDNVSLRYRLADHLGSATTELNYAGAKTADVRYEPWGTERWVQTALSVPYLFTSQRWDSELGLYDYQARYYDAKIGRFISADAIVPDPKNPQSLNRFSYSYNSPVIYTDPSGHCPRCVHFEDASAALTVELGEWSAPRSLERTPFSNQPQIPTSNAVGGVGDRVLARRVPIPLPADPAKPLDVTSWLVEQMVNNASGPVAESLARGLQSTDLEDQAVSVTRWVHHVKGGGVWDFKVQFRLADRNVVTIGGRNFKMDVVANIHFGYVGRAIGFSSEFLTAGGGIAQILAQKSDPSYFSTYFDNPYDFAAVLFGAWLFETYGYDLTEEALMEAISQYGDYLKTAGE